MKMNVKFWCLALGLLLFSACERSEESKVREAAQTFVKGRMALASNDSTLIREVSADTLYQMIMLNHRYTTLINGRTSALTDLGMMRPGDIKINGNEATCAMVFYEPYVLNMRKYGEEWKVRGENEHYPDADLIARTQAKYDEQAALRKQRPLFDSVITVINDFYMSAKYHFRTPSPDMLRNSCSDEVVALVERIKKVAIAKIGTEVLFEEMGHEDFTPGDIERVGEKVVFRLYQEPTKLTLKLVNGKYQIIGINDSESLRINDENIALNLTSYLRAMKIVRAENYRNKKI